MYKHLISILYQFYINLGKIKIGILQHTNNIHFINIILYYIIMKHLLLLGLLIIINFFYLKETFGRAVKNTNIKNNYIYKKFKNESTYKRIKKYYNDILYQWDFVPFMDFDDKTLTIKEEYFDTILDKSNKPSDYIKQLRNIDNTIKSAGLFHNDYRTKGPGHFFVKNNKIYLIDYDGLSKTEHLPRNDIEKIIKAL